MEPIHKQSISNMEPEVTVICVDNSTLVTSIYGGGGVYKAQAKAIRLYCKEKIKAHPDNEVGLLAMGEIQGTGFVGPTRDLRGICSKLKGLLYLGQMCIPIGQALCFFLNSKLPKRRLLVFSGGRLSMDSDELEDFAARFKAYNVAVDVVNFGVQCCPTAKKQLLEAFVAAADNNGNSHYLYAPSGSRTSLAQQILSSPLTSGSSNARGEGKGCCSEEYILGKDVDGQSQITVICVENSTLVTSIYGGGGVYKAQAKAIALYCKEKLKAHPDNEVGLLAMGEIQGTGFVGPTCDLRRIYSKLKGLLYLGQMCIPIGQALCFFLNSKLPKRRLLVFSGGRLSMDSDELEDFAARFKAYNVAVDVVNFGVQCCPTAKKQLLEAFVAAADNNGNSHYLYAPSGSRTSLAQQILRICSKFKGLLYIGQMCIPIGQALCFFLNSKLPKRRLLVFSGGRLSMDSDELEDFAARFKAYNVAVDVVNFGVQCCPTAKKQLLEAFVAAADNNGNSHYLYAPSGSSTSLAQQILSSPLAPTGSSNATGEEIGSCR
ncbi:26S proteasome non-ATPase regulatory subunit 4 [Artemisia annua]|uniref:26S proteasome non-ATPase regulatory subunit 4 n=1 Tax=Artemisia annua TaxID=35608 RepID=A0A2U1N629_ARTAN|nr:26S proteasome non-ATPase regulatory subunit 4 [Artemisia annua]